MENINIENVGTGHCPVRLSWKSVEKYLENNNAAGRNMALIESDKIFTETLKQCGFKGEDVDKQINALSFVFSNCQKLKKARENVNKIIKNINFEISEEYFKNSIEAYYTAVAELLKFKDKKIGFWGKAKLKIKSAFPSSTKFIKDFILYFFGFFLIVFILDSTSFGRGVAYFFARISHVIFSWVLLLILLIAGIAILVIGTIYYFESRKKN